MSKAGCVRTMWLTLQPLTYYIEPVMHTPKKCVGGDDGIDNYNIGVAVRSGDEISHVS